MSSALRLAEHPLVNALGWSLLHFLWEGALIGLSAYALLRGIRPAAASTRYLIGVATLGALLVAPIITFTLLANGAPMQINLPSRVSAG